MNGRLSFRVVGEAQYPQKAEYSNFNSRDYQYIIVRQERDLSDVLFRKIIYRFLGVTGEFVFFFIARARINSLLPDAKLIGKVYLFRAFSDTYSATSRQFERLMVEFRRLEQAESNSTLTREAREVYKQTHNILDAGCEVSAELILRRDGIITIKDISWNRSVLRENSYEFAEADHVDMEHIIADQYYFFVRDIVHQHQHHSPDADTIITTHRAIGDDKAWCAQVLYSLHYHIITIKRSKDNAEQIRAVGILAYIGSFEKIAQKIGCKVLPQFYVDTAKQSIEASKSYLELELARQRQVTEKSRTIAFWLAGAALTILGLVARFADQDGPKDTLAVELANFTQKHASAIILLPIMTIVVVWLSGKVINSKRTYLRELVMDLARLFIWNKYLFGFISVTIIVLGAYFVFWPALIEVLGSLAQH